LGFVSMVTVKPVSGSRMVMAAPEILVLRIGPPELLGDGVEWCGWSDPKL
jgi:hypothetical protein